MISRIERWPGFCASPTYEGEYDKKVKIWHFNINMTSMKCKKVRTEEPGKKFTETYPEICRNEIWYNIEKKRVRCAKVNIVVFRFWVAKTVKETNAVLLFLI